MQEDAANCHWRVCRPSTVPLYGSVPRAPPPEEQSAMNARDSGRARTHGLCYCETRATIRPHHLRTRSVTGSPRPFDKQTPGAQDYSPRVTERRNEVRDRRVTRNRPRCPATHGNNSGPHAARPRARSSRTATGTAAALEWAQAANRFAHGPRHATRGRAQAPRQASSRRAVDEEASSRQQQTEPAQAS